MSRPVPSPPRALIVDDESGLRALVSQFLEAEGIDCEEAADGETALVRLRAAAPDVVLLDMNLPGISGLHVLREARKLNACPPIIMVTGNGRIDAAVEAVKSGAYDYVTKPFNDSVLLLTVRRAVQSHRLEQENRRLRSQVDAELSLRALMGPSDAVAALIAEVERVAPTDFTVIVGGETGSGKELVARAIHHLSRRAAAAFVPVDCGAIQPTLIESELFGHEKGAFTGADRARPGKFEAAAGGTLFLDEVQNLPLPVQTTLLRAVQDRQVSRVGGTTSLHVDLRVVAASNEDLPALAAAGRFRQDLYHRLNEFAIQVPPLRRRREDIVYLAKRFLDLTAAELHKEVPRLSSPALEQLLAYSWPGNVRELRNIIRRAVLLADTEIAVDHLGLRAVEPVPSPAVQASALDGTQSLKDMVRRKVVEVERAILTQVLKQTGGNKAKAARLLHIDYKTMQTKTKEYGIEVE